NTASLPEGAYYVNDHALLRLSGGGWILTGIFHPEPLDASAERDFVLAMARPSEPSEWYASQAPAFLVSPARYALRAARDEPWIWAPHLARDEDDGSYVMIYHAGSADPDRGAFRLARSRDGSSWTRQGGTLFEDICKARDPMLFRLGADWIVYYTR